MQCQYKGKMKIQNCSRDDTTFYLRVRLLFRLAKSWKMLEQLTPRSSVGKCFGSDKSVQRGANKDTFGCVRNQQYTISKIKVSRTFPGNRDGHIPSVYSWDQDVWGCGPVRYLLTSISPPSSSLQDGNVIQAGSWEG